MRGGLTGEPGVQSVADAVMAAEAGADGILISNHGGELVTFPFSIHFFTFCLK